MEKVEECRLTTIDNPFDPFDQFDEWYRYDEEVLDYGTCSLLARFSIDTSGLSDEEAIIENNNVIDHIIRYDSRDIYIKVKRKPKTEQKSV